MFASSKIKILDEIFKIDEELGKRYWSYFSVKIYICRY